MQLPHGPFAFLASRMDPTHERLSTLRREIYDFGQRSGRPIWVAEYSEPELANCVPLEIQTTCLERARAADEFIAVLDGSYGRPWNLFEVCVLELEMLTAALGGKPFHLFLLAPYDPNPRIDSLQRALMLARPDLVDTRPKSEDEILSELMARLGGVHSHRGGALAIKYYSIAKSTPTGRQRRILLERALASVNKALEGSPPDPSGLYGIRASILQARGRLRQGLADYRRMLDIRTLRGEGAGRIGEAEAELGMGYLRLGHIFRAGDFLTRGVSNLERSDRHPFTVRALMKLAAFYLLTLRLHKALQTLKRAEVIAREHEIRGQLSQIEPLLRRLELLDWRGWFHRPTSGV